MGAESPRALTQTAAPSTNRRQRTHDLVILRLLEFLDGDDLGVLLVPALQHDAVRAFAHDPAARLAARVTLSESAWILLHTLGWQRLTHDMTF